MSKKYEKKFQRCSQNSVKTSKMEVFKKIGIAISYQMVIPVNCFGRKLDLDV